MTAKEQDHAALACASRMIDYCDANRHYGHYTGYTNRKEALRGIASGDAGFGDLCDDNIFIHEVLSDKGLIPSDVQEAMNSDKALDVWNSVTARLQWAASQLLKESK